MTQLYAQPTARNEQVSVTTTSSVVADATFKGMPRRHIIFRNTSANAADIITLSLGQDAAISNHGIVLRQYDSYIESMVNDPELDVWQGAIQAICATANGKLSISEV